MDEPGQGRPAAFIDRDGVINVERDYVHRIEDFELLPGAIPGLRTLQQAGYALVVVTNQAGIARGYYTEADFERLTAHMRHLLEAEGIQLTAVYHCPHHPSAGLGELRVDCDCRKPAPGMLLRASRELDLSLTTSVLVGDKGSDIEAGRRAGLARCVLVRSGHAPGDDAMAAADATLDDLAQAAAWLTGAPPPRPHHPAAPLSVDAPLQDRP